MKFLTKASCGLVVVCLSSGAMGHAGYIPKDTLDSYTGTEYQENTTAYLNLAITHGCRDNEGNTFATKYFGVVFPNKIDLQGQGYTVDTAGKRYGGNAVMSIKASIDNNWKNIRQLYGTVSSFYSHGEKTKDVRAIHWLDGYVPDDMYAGLKFRAQFPKLDGCVSRLKVFTPAIQYCENGLVTVWTRKPTTLFSEDVISPNYAPSFEIVRDVATNPLPESCAAGEEVTLEAEPTAEEIDWYFSPRSEY